MGIEIEIEASLSLGVKRLEIEAGS